MTRPTLHLTNWSSRRLHGPGRLLTIMREPRAWEHGEGRVPALIPSRPDLHAVRAGEITHEEYARRCEANFRRGGLRPGSDATFDERIAAGTLWTVAGGGTAVRDGDTLCCACSREAAARGECHRVVAARLLVEAGWRVVLDGEEVSDGR